MDAVVANWDNYRVIVGHIDADNKLVSEEFYPDKDAGEDFILPSIPDTFPSITTLLWPMEDLLIRSFSLPLPSLRLLDAQVLGQELEDLSGVEAGEWWLAWQAKKEEEQVVGVVFALPQAMKSALSSHRLGYCKYFWPDGWARLTALLPDHEAEVVAVLDADEQGLFLGVFNRGAWSGMRRLNFVSSRSMEDIANDIHLSLTAMEYTPDLPARGRLNEALLELLGKRITWQGTTLPSLPSRLESNIRAVHELPGAVSGPNFRHSSWAAKADWVLQALPWRRAAALVALVVTFSFFSDVYTLSALHGRMASGQRKVEELFHQALPKEKVIIDPIAQLRNAAGTSGNKVQSWYYLKQLEAVAKLKNRFGGLALREVNLVDGGMVLDGNIENFALVNKVRDELSKLVHGKVTVVDTELEKESKHVRFRLKWS